MQKKNQVILTLWVSFFHIFGFLTCFSPSDKKIIKNYPLKLHSSKFSCKFTAFIAGNCVLCCFNSEFTKKINKCIYKTDKNTNIFVYFIGFVCDFIDFVCEFTDKTTERTVASYSHCFHIYESSDFT
jgi:hypothetical protein